MAFSQYHSLQPQQDEDLEFATARSKDDHGSNGDSELHSRSELLFRKKLHMSFDLNQTMITPTSFGFEEMILFPIINQRDALNMSCLQKDREKTSLKPMETSDEDERIANAIDLELRLSPPTGSEISGKLTSCVSSQSEEVASLVLMGCTSCYMYVMVSERDPKCPKCQTSILIDMFRGNNFRAKRPRMS